MANWSKPDFDNRSEDQQLIDRDAPDLREKRQKIPMDIGTNKEGYHLMRRGGQLDAQNQVRRYI